MSWACDQAFTSTILSSYQVAGPLFVQTLQSFFAAQCALTGDHLWPADATEAVLEDPNYDFIVIGAGSAGAVVANRLSENLNWKVLLVEAGGNPTLLTEIPNLFYNGVSSPLDWDYKTQPQDDACRAYKSKGCAWPRGKVIGGSSSINAMCYVRANRADYDQWAADGNHGWSYEEVLPYFLKSENFDGNITDGNNKYHSRDGPLHVKVPTDLHPVESLIIQAAKELGMQNINDANGANQMGVLATHTNVKDNYRFSTARAYLSPVKDRKNLHVMKHTYATKILFTPGTNRISGVLLTKDGKDITVKVHKELIVSAGTVNSPQLLMLSGIGPERHLKEMGIKVKADLPVGENLQDHVLSLIFYTKPAPKELVTLPNIASAFVQYMLEGTGIFADTRPSRIISFFNTTDSTSSIPDMQFHYLVLDPQATHVVAFPENHKVNEDVMSEFFKMNEDSFTLVVYNVLLHPKSIGKILLASKNPFDKPLIYANYFKDPEDMACLIRGMKQHALKLGDTETFKQDGWKLEWLDLDACKSFEKASDEHLDCVARELTFSLYHPVGTAKMGPDSDENSVVDPELKVRKVKGLRVIDASVMPSVVRGNTHAAVTMIGEKGADLIKKYWTNRLNDEL